jgi:protein dithiol oxidoreductase (disulfide-forming)
MLSSSCTRSTRRRFLALAACGMLGVSRFAVAQAIERAFEESYRTIAPQATPVGDKIEVIDFFWYGCPYCYQLMPLIEAWDKTKPADVTLRRVPAVLREEWLPDAHLYYTLELLGAADRLHTKVFDALHRDRVLITDRESWAKWAVANGIERAKWDEAYNEKTVRDNVLRAVETARDYDVRGTPVLVVDGRYQTGGGLAGSLKNVMPTVTGLVNLARERRKKSQI